MRHSPNEKGLLLHARFMVQVGDYVEDGEDKWIFRWYEEKVIRGYPVRIWLATVEEDPKGDYGCLGISEIAVPVH